jgi:hypothetical protein
VSVQGSVSGGRGLSGSDSNRDPVEELAEEFADRYRRGERPSLSEYTARYPEHANAIRKVFPALLFMENLEPASQSTGPLETDANLGGRRLEEIGDCRILREVGRGGMASSTRPSRARCASQRGRTQPRRASEGRRPRARRASEGTAQGGKRGPLLGALARARGPLAGDIVQIIDIRTGKVTDSADEG